MTGDVDPAYTDPDAYSRAEAADEAGSYPPDWPARRRAVYDRQDGRCCSCGEAVATPGEMMVSHVRPPSEGGDHRLTNLVGRCSTCHSLGVDAVAWVHHRDLRPRDTEVVDTDEDETESREFSDAGMTAGLLAVVYGLAYGTAGPEAPGSLLAFPGWFLTRQFEALVGATNAALSVLVDVVIVVVFVAIFVMWINEV